VTPDIRQSIVSVIVQTAALVQCHLCRIVICNFWNNNNNNNNTHICIAPCGRNFRGAVGRECASESEKREESKPERKEMSLAEI